MNGRPLDLRWAAEHVPAILDIWYPGTQGGAAVANLLFGDVVARRQAAVHLAAHRRAGPDDLLPHPSRTSRRTRAERYWDEPSTPLFPFGHGLSYAHVQLRGPDRRPRPRSRRTSQLDGLGRRSPTTATATADEVVQLYIHQRYGSASRPVRELKGFERVSPGGRGVASRSSSRWGRPSCATGTPRRGTGWSTPRSSTSGSAATRRPP